MLTLKQPIRRPRRQVHALELPNEHDHQEGQAAARDHVPPRQGRAVHYAMCIRDVTCVRAQWVSGVSVMLHVQAG